MAQVAQLPAATALTAPRPLTRVGTSRKLVEPLPSSPLTPLPQQYSVSLRSMAQVWLRPAAILSSGDGAGVGVTVSVAGWLKSRPAPL